MWEKNLSIYAKESVSKIAHRLTDRQTDRQTDSLRALILHSFMISLCLSVSLSLSLSLNLLVCGMTCCDVVHHNRVYVCQDIESRSPLHVFPFSKLHVAVPEDLSLPQLLPVPPAVTATNNDTNKVKVSLRQHIFFIICEKVKYAVDPFEKLMQSFWVNALATCEVSATAPTYLLECLPVLVICEKPL